MRDTGRPWSQATSTPPAATISPICGSAFTSFREAGYISDHDALIADHLAHVLCGGELSQPAWMDEQYFLDLEREAFIILCGYTEEPGTDLAHAE